MGAFLAERFALRIAEMKEQGLFDGEAGNETGVF
jgi:hypothetical protein